VIGLDGGVGLPGYSGLFPNPMLANSLITARELLLAGSASEAYQQPWAQENVPAAFRTELEISDKSISRLQPNVRAALCEMELLSGSTWTCKDLVADWQVSGKSVVKLSRPDQKIFMAQLKVVQSYSDLRAERTNEILAQVVPQSAGWAAIAGLTPERHRYTWELIGIGLRFAMMQVMQFKGRLDCPRPSEYGATIQPMILTPGYAAYPSGHATEAFFIAELLPLLVEEARKTPPTTATTLKWGKETDCDRRTLRSQLHRFAYRVAENRVVAGLHFPIDAIAGELLGAVAARHVAWCCGVLGARPIENSKYEPGPETEDWKSIQTTKYEPMLDHWLSCGISAGAPMSSPPARSCEHLKWLWSKVKEEVV